jgi:hypothetical protein
LSGLRSRGLDDFTEKLRLVGEHAVDACVDQQLEPPAPVDRPDHYRLDPTPAACL